VKALQIQGLVNARTLLLALLVCFTSGMASAQDNSSHSRVLILNTEIAQYRYCEASGGEVMLRLSLKLVFRNTSNSERVIFPRDSNIVGGMEITSYANGQPLANPLEVEIDQVITSLRDDVASYPGDGYVILKPTKSFATHATVDFGIRLHDAAKWQEASPGEHALSIMVPTWFGTEQAGLLARDRWKKYGFLETESVKSEPMKFHIETNPEAERCSPTPQP
jgi:hypothetical protein